VDCSFAGPRAASGVTGGEPARQTLYCEYNVPVTSRDISKLFGKCLKDVPQAIKEEKVVSVTKIVTIEKLLDDQLAINH
jgi:hypothetical protein